MTRYIDADAYLQKICTYNETGCGSCRFQTKCPADEPTIEAEPVRHGKWIEHHGGVSTYYSCSNCGGEPYYASSIYTLKFCPFCGARMDE